MVPRPLDTQAARYATGAALPQAGRKRNRKNWPIVVISVLAVLVLGLGAALGVTALTKKSPSASGSATGVAGSRSSVPVTSPPPTPAPTTSTNGAAQAQAQALSSLVGNSAVDRAQIVSAVQQIHSCGNLSGAQEMLDQAATSRQSLLHQLNQLQLGDLPNGSQLSSSLQAAWEASVASDNSYAAYAGDELSNFNGCTPDDSGDTNAEAAATSDAQATAAKIQFVAVWNPIAAAYGLPQWQASSL